MKTTAKDQLDTVRDYYETHDPADEIAAAELTAHDPADTSAMAGYSVRLPKEILAGAREQARKRGVSTGAWLREVIENAVTGRAETSGDPVAAALALIAELVEAQPTAAAADPTTRPVTVSDRQIVALAGSNITITTGGAGRIYSARTGAGRIYSTKKSGKQLASAKRTNRTKSGR